MNIDCGHGPGICELCQSSLDELQALCRKVGLGLDVVYEVRFVHPDREDAPDGGGAT